uniref:DEAD/SNF2-like helicase n=1 Tax=Pithovirus LCPAC401 TaxID=2506595 RepID=A0A481Z9U2_9VIRU|nr:MAG: DEAD/SNF2-like helicase [Pithovirus LCPAC401]
MDLVSLLPLYPSQNDPNIQSLIYSHKEFRDLSLSLSEPIPKKGEYFIHQKLLPRLMRFCDCMFIMSAVGTGKTLSVVAVAEYMIDHPELGIDKCLILTHNETLGAHFKSEIVKMNDSLSQFRNEDILTSTEKSKITTTLRSINVKSNGDLRSPPFEYDIQTHISFGNSLKNKDDGWIRRKYSGYLIAIDEVHKIAVKELTTLKWNIFRKARESIGKIYEVKEVTVEMEEKEELKELVPKAKKRKKSKNPTATELAYMNIHNLLHIAKVKTLLLSATPMENDPSDFAPILNLILPYKDQMTSNQEWWRKADRDTLEPYFRGKISYVRAIDNCLDLITKGIRLKFKIKNVDIDRVIEVSEMSPLQEKEYIRANSSILEKIEGLALPLRLISNFVFPDGRYDNADEFIYAKTFELPAILPKMKPALKETLRLSNLDMYSPKYKRIFDINNEYPRRACLIYTPYVTSGSFILTGIFYYNDYYHFTTEKSLNSRDDYKRFATINVDLSVERREEIFRAFKSPNNWDGRIIKVIIGSRLILFGLNIGNVMLIQIAGPEWNEAKNQQAIGRAIRATSHVHILARIPKGERIEVLIYQHASVLTTETGEYCLDESIDTRMYGIGQVKDKRNTRVFRIAKEFAIDCQLNKKRNIRPSDVPNSPECDYTSCNYSCSSTDITLPIEYSNYDILYNDNLIDNLIRNIVILFLTSSRFTFDTIVNQMKGKIINEKYIREALFKLISEKIRVFDRFGISCYIESHGNEVYLRRDYPIGSSNISDSYYTENLTAILSRGPVTVSPVDNTAVLNVLKSRGMVFWDLYYNLSTENRIDVLERSVVDNVHPELLKRLNMLFLRVGGKAVHIMKNQIKTSKQIYTTTTSYQKIIGYMRILDGDSWRDATKKEETLYEPFILTNQNRIELPFDEKKVYGTIATMDNKFRIRNKMKLKKGKKATSRGSVCKANTKSKLMETILKYKIRSPKPAEIVSPNLMRQFITKYFAENLSSSDVKLVYEWYAMETPTKKGVSFGFKKDDMCDVIKKYFLENDLILWI